MNKKLAEYRKWLGEWRGRGVSRDDVVATTRVSIRSRMADLAIEFVVESSNAETGELVHGVISLLSVNPNNEMCMLVYSTLHGSMLMPVTPEDPGALAVAGTSVQGNHVVVSLVEEGDGLMLTSYWKPHLPADAERVGFTNVKLKRVSLATG